jgi:hypothetical protein
MHAISRVLLIVIALISAIGPFAASRGAFAQDTATVSVTGEITSALSLSTCDTTADFGKGLTAFGATPTGTTDIVSPSQSGESSLGQGVFYVWKSPCDSGGYLFRVDATAPWILTVCATENTGAAGNVVGNGVLRWYYGFELDNSPTYSKAAWANPFNTDCQSHNYGISGGPNRDFPLEIRYLLRVDLGQATGPINVSTTWTLSF